MGRWLWVAGGSVGLLLGAGLMDLSPGLLGLIIGGAFGWLIQKHLVQGRRLAALEAILAGQPQPALLQTSPGGETTAPAVTTGATRLEAEAVDSTGPLSSVLISGPPTMAHAGDVDDDHRADTQPAATHTGAIHPPAGPPVAWPLQDRIKRWFTEGNVPVKVGMLVLFAGVGALLKYASDEGWLRLPIELRLAAISLAASGALFFGFRQRTSRRSFGLGLQGGAIGILNLTIFAAFRLYYLLPSPLAFSLLVVLVAGAGCLAVLQHSMSLAVLGTLAGFLAPILVSDGSGNHVVLFTWYALLNTGVLVVARVRAWRVLNLVGFLCTFAVASAWGVLRYEPDQFATTEPFLILFFAFYLAIPILYARSQTAGARVVDGTLVFGTPLFTFGLQAILLEGEALPLAASALVIALVHLALALALVRRAPFRLLGASHAVLAVGFATLTVPLALSGQVTASVFALEGAALVWLGLKQRRLLPALSGLALQALAALAWTSTSDVYRTTDIPIANSTFLGALLLAMGAFTSAWLLWRARPDSVSDATDRPAPLPVAGAQTSLFTSEALAVGATLLTLWGLLWWGIACLAEFEHFLHEEVVPDAWLVWTIVTAWIAAEAARRLHAPLLPWVSAMALAFATPILLAQTMAHDQPFGDYGVVAWAAFAVLGMRTLWCLGAVGSGNVAPALSGTSGSHHSGSHHTGSHHSSSGAGAEVAVGRGALRLAHLGWLWAWPWALTIALSESAQRAGLGSSWMALGLPVLLFHGFTLLRPAWVSWPLGHRFGEYRSAILTGQAVVLALGSFAALWFPGDADPLPWVPLLNPQDLLGVLGLALFALWLADRDAPKFLAARRTGLVAIWAFSLLTVATLRAVHHLGQLPWDASLLSASSTQTSLSIVWSLVGVAAWVVGSRRSNRLLWLAGALLMGVVLMKLALIDRQHLGNLTGIASFLAYGLLCTVVGYLAPAPAQTPVEPPTPPTGLGAETHRTPSTQASPEARPEP